MKFFFVSVTTASATITLATAEQFHAISSPNYPGNYPNGVDRSFIIHSPEGSSVKLDILDLEIESSCNYDTLRIYDGKLYLATKHQEMNINYNRSIRCDSALFLIKPNLPICYHMLFVKQTYPSLQ